MQAVTRRLPPPPPPPPPTAVAAAAAATTFAPALAAPQWVEERVPSALADADESPQLRNALGSVAAGSVAGYFSHVPHNLSTLKVVRSQPSSARAARARGWARRGGGGGHGGGGVGD